MRVSWFSVGRGMKTTPGARMTEPENRIRELREAAGYTLEELAKRCDPPTSTAQVQRLETRQRELTFKWMLRIAAGLNCHPADLMVVPLPPSIDVRLAKDQVTKQISDSLKARGLAIYEVLTNVVSGVGIDRGDLITVDENGSEPIGGDVVVIELNPGGPLLLRVFVGGGLVTTNRVGRNDASRLIDLDKRARILGVVVAGNGDGG